MCTKKFKFGDSVIYVPEMYDQQKAVFLHRIHGEAFIRLDETMGVKKVSFNTLHPLNRG